MSQSVRGYPGGVSGSQACPIETGVQVVYPGEAASSVNKTSIRSSISRRTASSGHIAGTTRSRELGREGAANKSS